ncbi:MAG: glycosyltransferase, partial [Oscillospiraceae bacterium]|nr:glycosyltransferase [Oscillospiraceae bacterium]
VLMSVYQKEKAENLKAAMDSIWRQTVPTDDFVLVCDGPLTPELDAVVAEMEAQHPGVLHVVRLEENRGLGSALNTGLRACGHALVARMDSDDISRPDRCEKQLRVFAAQPELAICSGIVEEFSDSPAHVDARRIPPETHEEILAFAKSRNPFNHPCVMYRKAAVEAVGSYRHFYLLEDYYLWIRMLQAGARGYNLQEPLLWMRAGPQMYRRRSGAEYAKSQRALFKYMRDAGMIGTPRYYASVVERTCASLIPNGLRELVYRTAMRK